MVVFSAFVCSSDCCDIIVTTLGSGMGDIPPHSGHEVIIVISMCIQQCARMNMIRSVPCTHVVLLRSATPQYVPAKVLPKSSVPVAISITIS
jgi:hypothetical protein